MVYQQEQPCSCTQLLSRHVSQLPGYTNIKLYSRYPKGKCTWLITTKAVTTYGDVAIWHITLCLFFLPQPVRCPATPSLSRWLVPPPLAVSCWSRLQPLELSMIRLLSTTSISVIHSSSCRISILGIFTFTALSKKAVEIQLHHLLFRLVKDLGHIFYSYIKIFKLYIKLDCKLNISYY